MTDTPERVKPVVESLALSNEAGCDNTVLEFSFAFSVNSKVLPCARRWDGLGGKTARNPDGATHRGVRRRRALASCRKLRQS